MSEPLTFLASLPPIQSAIKIGLDETRLQLSIPASEAAAIGLLHGLHGKVLSVAIVEVEPESLTGLDDAPTEKAKREPRRLDRRRA